MNKILAFTLKILILIIAIISIIALIYFPKTEGRAVDLNIFEIYSDLLIIYVYTSFIPFFYGLFQAFKLLTLKEKNKLNSKEALKIAKKIKYSASLIILLIVAALIYIRLILSVNLAQNEDPAGPTMLGFISILIFTFIAFLGAVIEKNIKNALDLKSK